MMTTPRQGYGLAYHVHPNRLIEVCEDYSERLAWIHGARLAGKRALRERLFHMLPDSLLPVALRPLVEATRTVWAQRKPLYDAYWAKRQPLIDDCKTKVKPLADAYWAQLQPLTAAYRAQVQPLTAAYWAPRKVLDDDYGYGDDYRTKRRQLDAVYHAKVKPLADAYQAKVKALYDDYQAKVQPLATACQAQVQPLDDAYQAQLKALYAVYRTQRRLLGKAMRKHMPELEALHARLCVADCPWNGETIFAEAK